MKNNGNKSLVANPAPAPVANPEAKSSEDEPAPEAKSSEEEYNNNDESIDDVKGQLIGHLQVLGIKLGNIEVENMPNIEKLIEIIRAADFSEEFLRQLIFRVDAVNKSFDLFDAESVIRRNQGLFTDLNDILEKNDQTNDIIDEISSSDEETDSLEARQKLITELTEQYAEQLRFTIAWTKNDVEFMLDVIRTYVDAGVKMFYYIPADVKRTFDGFDDKIIKELNSACEMMNLSSADLTNIRMENGKLVGASKIDVCRVYMSILNETALCDYIAKYREYIDVENMLDVYQRAVMYNGTVEDIFNNNNVAGGYFTGYLKADNKHNDESETKASVQESIRGEIDEDVYMYVSGLNVGSARRVPYGFAVAMNNIIVLINSPEYVKLTDDIESLFDDNVLTFDFKLTNTNNGFAGLKGGVMDSDVLGTYYEGIDYNAYDILYGKSCFGMSRYDNQSLFSQIALKYNQLNNQGVIKLYPHSICTNIIISSCAVKSYLKELGGALETVVENNEENLKSYSGSGASLLVFMKLMGNVTHNNAKGLRWDERTFRDWATKDWTVTTIDLEGPSVINGPYSMLVFRSYPKSVIDIDYTSYDITSYTRFNPNNEFCIPLYKSVLKKIVDDINYAGCLMACVTGIVAATTYEDFDNKEERQFYDQSESIFGIN